MPVWDKCSGCALRSGYGRCSFNRLVEAAIPEGFIVDYVETPACIRIICEDVCFLCDPEEAHALLCSLVRRPVAVEGAETPGMRPVVSSGSAPRRLAVGA